MKIILGVLLILLAVAIAVVPAFTDCASQGKQLTTDTGKKIDMKCHWTGRAELALGVPLAGVGLLIALSRRKETRRALALVGTLIGIMAILVPVLLIGVCTGELMICHSTMRPVLILAGALTIAASGLAFLTSLGSDAGV